MIIIYSHFSYLCHRFTEFVTYNFLHMQAVVATFVCLGLLIALWCNMLSYGVDESKRKSMLWTNLEINQQVLYLFPVYWWTINSISRNTYRVRYSLLHLIGWWISSGNWMFINSNVVSVDFYTRRLLAQHWSYAVFFEVLFSCGDNSNLSKGKTTLLSVLITSFPVYLPRIDGK